MNTDVKNSRSFAQFPADRGVGLCRQALLALLVSCCTSGPARANPAGAQVVSGQVSISNSGNALTVTNSPGSIINWQSFSINPGELTRFLQQSANSSVLNRIVGQDPSQILGALQSNGKVYLINPNGILFGANSRVNVGGLVASTLDISNSDFSAGKLNFNSAAQAGAVTNQGNITTPAGGQIYLIAPQVQNNGILNSPQGEVLLAAGHSVQLVDGGDPNMQVVISAPTDQALNLGQVVVQGGKIGIYGALVNQLGIVSADSAVLGANGEIVFKASQTTTLSGNSQTTATGSGSGGSIYLLGNQVGLTDNAQVDASGQTGGGTVLVGGDYHGANPAIQNATSTYVGADTSIKADAIQNGNGGKVIVWSEDATRAYGSISAQAGALGGNGGSIETSGHYLDVSGITINAGAPKGSPGTWLLDPYNITIGTGTDTSTNSGPTSPITYGGTTSNSLLLASTVTSALNAGTSVIVDTSVGAGADAGTITVSSPIATIPSGSPTLTLKANQDININADITSAGDPLAVVLTAGATGTININASIVTNNASLTINGGNALNIGGPSAQGLLDTGNISGSAGGAALNILLPNTSTITVYNNPTTNYYNSGYMINANSVTLAGGTLNLNGNVTANGGPITLTAGAGGIRNSGTGLLTGNTLEVNSVGSVAITGNNNFNTLAANVSGSGNSLSIDDSAPNLTIGSVGSTTGVSAPGGIFIEQYLSGGITISGPINAVTSASLTAAGSITQGTGGLITAGVLDLSAGSAAGIGTSAAPLLTNVGTLTATANSAVSPGGVYINNSSAALMVDYVNTPGNVIVNTAGSLTIPYCDCNSTDGVSVTLTSQGAMTIDNSIYASNSSINLTSQGAMTIGAGSGTYVTIEASGGAVNLNSAGSLTIPDYPSNSNSYPVVSGTSATLTSQGAMYIGNASVSNTITATAGPIDLYAGYAVAGGTAVAPSALMVNGNMSATGAIGLWAGGPITQSGSLTPAPSVNQNTYVAPPPTLTQCVATPTLTGCSAVLPTLAQCTSAPTTAGCSVVLPTLAQCTSAPTTAGCSVVLPTLAQCTTAPTTSGCSVVLPTLTQCIAAPTTAGCSAVLPTLAQCTAAPTAAGCSVVLPTLAQCTAAPTTAGCTVVLPTLAQCTAAPTAAGCSVVLPTLAQCTSTPTVAGCSVVLPTLAQCTSAPTTAGCSAVLPTLAQCTAAPSTPGCAPTLPTLAQCASNPNLAGCNAVLPPPGQLQNTAPILLATNTTVTAINTSIISLSTGLTSGGGINLSTSGGSSGNAGTTNTGATNNGTTKKLYCN